MPLGWRRLGVLRHGRPPLARPTPDRFEDVVNLFSALPVTLRDVGCRRGSRTGFSTGAVEGAAMNRPRRRKQERSARGVALRSPRVSRD